MIIWTFWAKRGQLWSLIIVKVVHLWSLSWYCATIVYKRLTMIAPMSKWYNCDHYLVITVVEIPRGQLWSPKNLYFLHNLWLKFCWPQVYVPIHHTSRGICHTYSSFSTFSIELIRKEWWWFGRNDDDSEGMMMIWMEWWFGRNDDDSEGMMMIQKERWWFRRSDDDLEGMMKSYLKKFLFSELKNF